MAVDLAPLAGRTRLLFEIPLKPIQGQRFQPTGFPGLGAATFQTSAGAALLVESAQSMANRLETAVWNEGSQDFVGALAGISHVTVKRKGEFLTDTALESHRLNSPYLLEGSDRSFADKLKQDLGGLAEGPIDRRKLAETLLRYDIGSLLHGVFLAKKELAGGRLRVARAISAFIEAEQVNTAASGGVKNDHVNPQGDTGKGYGNVPFARDEFTAQCIVLYVNIDLAQIHGYGLGADAEKLLVLLALFKLRSLLDRGLRLRTACDLVPLSDVVKAVAPSEFPLPTGEELAAALKPAIAACAGRMSHTNVNYEDELKKGKDKDPVESRDDDQTPG